MNGAGTATITSVSGGQTQQLPCGGSTADASATATIWENCTYTNGAIPLTVNAEVFGPLTLPDNIKASVIDIAPSA
jgi:hypothetical protein